MVTSRRVRTWKPEKYRKKIERSDKADEYLSKFKSESDSAMTRLHTLTNNLDKLSIALDNEISTLSTHTRSLEAKRTDQPSPELESHINHLKKQLALKEESKREIYQKQRDLTVTLQHISRISSYATSIITNLHTARESLNRVYAKVEPTSGKNLTIKDVLKTEEARRLKEKINRVSDSFKAFKSSVRDLEKARTEIKNLEKKHKHKIELGGKSYAIPYTPTIINYFLSKTKSHRSNIKKYLKKVWKK